MKEARLNDEGEIVLKFNKISSADFYGIKGWIDSLDYRQYNSTAKEWTVKCTEEIYEKIKEFNFNIDPQIFQLVGNVVIDESYLDLPLPDKYKFLYEDQQRVFRYAMANNWKILNAGDMGCGKTATSLSILDYAEYYPALIVCPTSVIPNWKNQYRKWLNDEDRIKVIEGSKDLRYYGDEYDVYIVGYPLLARQMVKTKTNGGDIFLPKKPLKEFYKTFHETVILDEVHKIKSHTSQTTNAVKYLCSGAESILALTGTPILNTHKELYPILNILRPEKFNNYYQFCERFCEKKITYLGKRKKTSYHGARNKEELFSLLRDGIMIRFTQKQIKEIRGEEYLKPNITILPMKANGKSKYEDAEKSFRESLANGESKTKALGNLSKMRIEAWNLKKKACFEFIDDILEEIGNEKIVIFFHNKPVLEDLIEKYGKSLVYISGETDTNPEVRDQVIKDFCEKGNVRIFAGSIGSCAEGIDSLQRKSCTMLFLQEAWNSGTRDQAYGRLSNRTGAIGRTNIFHLILPNSVEMLFLRLQDKKASISAMTIDGETIEEGDYMVNILNYYMDKEK